MPMWYKGIVPETKLVRNRVGIFDVSHMGRALISGPQAENFLDFATTNDVSTLKVRRAHYSLLLNETGGIKDDILVYRLTDTRFLIVFNAGNRRKDVDWLIGLAKHYRVDIQDVSNDVAMFAVQGPRGLNTLESLTGEQLSSTERFAFTDGEIAKVRCLLSRTGYTGEDGFEVFVWDSPIDKPENAVAVWQAILRSGSEYGIEPCGLGARDVLRLEAGMCLYGNDIDETITPLEARLGFAVKHDKPVFVGKEALDEKRREGPSRLRVGLTLLEKGIPRAGQNIENGRKVGQVTSGTFSPTVNAGIAMGYVEPELAKVGQPLSVRIRERRIRSVVARFPLYDTTKFGWQRATNIAQSS
jgi:aminomethyltransferase